VFSTPNPFSSHFLRRGGAILLILFAMSKPISAAESASRPATSFHWKRIPDLPDPVGLKGAFAGVSNGWVLHAGGSNFPVPRAAGGAKAFSDRIYVRPAGVTEAPWREASARLPYGLAEGATVTIDAGVIAIGGQTLKGPVADVFLLRADPTGERIERHPLPALPTPCANATATLCNGSIYVAGGEQAAKGMGNFWRLEVAAALASPPATAWQSLPSWPGPPRFGASLVTLERDGREQLFLFSGRGEALPPATIDEYLTDAYRYDPRSEQWARVAAMPHPA
jgi:N-acetylneuraminic acid mutarotase